ncbi:MAG: hypothetical protein LLG02_14115 [Pelosinus sp.]|nr:hypothetical protein [Pelosinus sp.]
MVSSSALKNVIQELKNDYDTAEEWLLFYPERLKQYYSDLNYIHDENRMHEVNVPTGPGNVVLQKVVSLAELDATEKWLITVELFESMLGPKKKLFLELRRKAAGRRKTVNGREVWRNYVQSHYAEEMGRQNFTSPNKFWLHDNTITNWWDEMVELLRLVALKRGCL